MANAAVKGKQDLKKPQHPQRRKTASARSSRLLLLIGAAGLIALAAVGIVLTRGSGDAPAGAGW